MAMPNRERLLVGLALLCIGALAVDHFVLSPIVAGWKARSARIAKLQQDLEKGELLLSREAALDERWREMLGRSLPASGAAAENQMLSSLGRWASSTDLDISDLRPRWINEKDQPPRLEIRLSANGSLDALRGFLYEVEATPLALRVEQVAVRARDDNGRDLGLETRISGLVLTEAKP